MRGRTVDIAELLASADSVRWFKSTSLTAGKVELASLRQVQPPQPQPTMNHAINSRLSGIEFLHLSGSLDPDHLSHFWKWLRCPILQTIYAKNKCTMGTRFLPVCSVSASPRRKPHKPAPRGRGVAPRRVGWRAPLRSDRKLRSKVTNPCVHVHGLPA